MTPCTPLKSQCVCILRSYVGLFFFRIEVICNFSVSSLVIDHFLAAATKELDSQQGKGGRVDDCLAHRAFATYTGILHS